MSTVIESVLEEGVCVSGYTTSFNCLFLIVSKLQEPHVTSRLCELLRLMYEYGCQYKSL